MSRCECEREKVKMWVCEDVKMSRCEDEKMWRWADVKMSRCEDEKVWRWEDVKMRRCERRCEDEKMWRWEGVREGVKMRRCEDEKVWRWEGVKMMRRWDTDPHYWKNPALRRSREKEHGKKSLMCFIGFNQIFLNIQFDFTGSWDSQVTAGRQSSRTGGPLPYLNVILTKLGQLPANSGVFKKHDCRILLNIVVPMLTQRCLNLSLSRLLNILNLPKCSMKMSCDFLESEIRVDVQ